MIISSGLSVWKMAAMGGWDGMNPTLFPMMLKSTTGQMIFV
jgi:hypothetical protein